MIAGLILDLDGTVYHGAAPVPGAAAFVASAAARGIRCLYVTNRANRAPEAVSGQLCELGIPCTPAAVLTSAQATAAYLRRGSVYCIGEAALLAELQRAGLALCAEAADYVVVSFDRQFTYEKLATASRLIRAGSKFIATNADRALPTEHGYVPGAGALVAAVQAATGVEPQVIGKPERIIMDMALERLGLPADQVVAVGDNLDTDIPAGARAGLRTVLLLTGVSAHEDPARAPGPPTWVAKDYAALERIVLGAG